MNVQSVAWIIKLRHYPVLIQSPDTYLAFLNLRGCKY